MQDFYVILKVIKLTNMMMYYCTWLKFLIIWLNTFQKRLRMSFETTKNFWATSTLKIKFLNFFEVSLSFINIFEACIYVFTKNFNALMKSFRISICICYTIPNETACLLCISSEYVRSQRYHNDLIHQSTLPLPSHHRHYKYSIYFHLIH